MTQNQLGHKGGEEAPSPGDDAHAHGAGCDHHHHDPAPEPCPLHAANARPSILIHELTEHMPFSVASVAIGIIVAGTICIAALRDDAGPVGGPGAGQVAMEQEAHIDPLGLDTSAPASGAEPAHDHDDHSGHVHAHGPAELFFHLFHPAHMLFSAAATTAMFSRYERRWSKAILVGLLGAIGVCGISDIAMPHFSAWLLGPRPELHLCIVDHPGLVLPFAVIGVIVGLSASRGVIRSTFMSHSLHVFTSTMASIFYMVRSLGLLEWIDIVGAVFVFVVLAVMIPCCLSDIVFPLLMARPSREAYMLEPHAH